MLERTAEEERAEQETRRQWAPPPSTADLEAELAGMRSSVSWRLNRPVRIVGTALRRLGLRG